MSRDLKKDSEDRRDIVSMLTSERGACAHTISS